MLTRGQNFKPVPLNIVGSSTFGLYPKISNEKTYNMFISDDWLVNYAGYKIAILAQQFANGKKGRGIYASTKFNRLVIVIDANVYLVNIGFNKLLGVVENPSVSLIGSLTSSTDEVYITENNKPQICISDNKNIYIYDPTISPTIQPQTVNFVPGQVDFHDTYFLCAPKFDGFQNATNTWRLSAQNNGTSWPDTSANIGLLQTKSDNTQAVIRFPSKGNMIFVMGTNVTEPWFDVGYQLFPYQRNTSYNIDYGCLNPLTIASMDGLVVWLGKNEKSGPVIMYSTGGEPQQISTDGINDLLSTMQNPEDSQGFIYRQDGHIFYHINFYSDNISLFYDFNTKKIFHACDEHGNYFIASYVAFFNNQYYFLSINNGNLYAMDTAFTVYQNTEIKEVKNLDGSTTNEIILVDHEIPRRRICKPLRNQQQEYYIANDCGFTIESGSTNYAIDNRGPQYLITQDGRYLILSGSQINLTTQDDKFLITQSGDQLITNQSDNTQVNYLISQQDDIVNITPRIDLAISIDGGEHFSTFDPQYLPPIGQRKNKLSWWQLGATNDLTCQFDFWGIGRFVATDGYVNIRQ